MASENNNWLDDALAKAIGSEKRGPNFAKWQQEHPQAVQMLKSQATRQTRLRSPLDIGKIIMRSPITKLAMAAVVIIAAGLAIHYFAGEGTQKCCAWERIADKVAQIKTCVYREHTRQSGGTIGQNGHQFEAKIYISSDYGYKSETTIDGNLMFQSYMNPGKKVMVVLMPLEKTYTRILLTDEMLGQMEKEMQDPREMVTKFMSGPYKELGKGTINGVEVKGIEVNNPPAVRNVYNNFIGRMWVDVATEYPVRMEIEAEIGTGAQKVNVVMVKDDFEWGTELSADIFKPDIPADFTLKAETKMPAQDETGAIDGFKCFSELTKGRYPSRMNEMSVTQEPMKALTQSFQQSIQQSLIKDMNLTSGVMPSEAMRQELIDKAKKLSEPMQQELMNKIMTLKGPVFFYNKLVQEDKDPVYHGDKVTAEFGDAVLMRWKVSDKQYRVIFGNLTVKTVSADELAVLEAMPLNRQPKAIKPKPADGAMCRQIADLELSWMPGMYAVTNKVYMGTAPNGLSLLADVSDDSNLIVQELHQKTYYWRVDGIDANGKTTTGDVWSFNTGKLVGWWKFDESTGTIAADSSGNGNNGVLKGNPVWRPTGGKTGGAIELGGKGDYVEISNESAFDINDQITVSAWVNITDVPQEWTGIVTKGDSAWRVSTSFAKNVFHFGVSSRDYINGTTTVDSGQWHNVVCVYDGQKMSIYVDGKPDVISMPLTVPIGTNDFPVCIGENIELKGHCFHGLIDDVRIYNYALSKDEVVELYSGSY